MFTAINRHRVLFSFTFFFDTGSYSVAQTSLASHSWPSCLSFLSVGTIGMCHHTTLYSKWGGGSRYQDPYSLFWGTESLIARFTQWARQANCQASGSMCLHLPRTQSTNIHDHTQLFTGVLGTELRSPCLSGKQFMNWALFQYSKAWILELVLCFASFCSVVRTGQRRMLAALCYYLHLIPLR